MMIKSERLALVILVTYLPMLAKDVFMKPFTKDYFRTLRKLIVTRGMRDTVAFVKNTRLAVTRYISGKPLTVVDKVALVRGWPKWLLSYKDHFPDLSHDSIRYLLSLLVVLRDIRFNPEIDLEPIESEWKGKLPSISAWEHRTIKKQLGIKHTPIQFNGYHISTKKGPNGQAMLTSTVDLDALPEEIWKDLILLAGSPWDELRNKILRIRQVNPTAYNLWNLISEFKGVPKIRKLSCFSDKEGKSRTIAIFDYWSQTILKPYHDKINSILKGINEDCTFNQNHFLQVLPESDGNRVFHSLDLKNATDRMPIELQKKVLASIIGRHKTEAWARILTSFEFTYRDRKDIKYRTGQPMGAYSSWPVMALTHHYIVRLAALKAHKKNFRDYCILGDDIVIADTDVANWYRRILSDLDMPISEQKTHESKYFYEFAKRYVYQGQEISPFQLSSFKSVYKRYYLLQNFLENQSLHGWKLERNLIPGLIQDIYNIYGKPRQAVSTWKLYDVFESLIQIKECGVTDTSLYDKLVLHFGLSSEYTPEQKVEVIEDSIRSVRRALIRDDSQKLREEIYEIGELTQALYDKHLGGLADQANIEQIRGWHPMVVTSQERLMDSLVNFSRTYDPDMGIPELMKVQGISMSIVKKEAFSIRTSKSILLATSQMVKRLITEVKEQLEYI